MGPYWIGPARTDTKRRRELGRMKREKEGRGREKGGGWLEEIPTVATDGPWACLEGYRGLHFLRQISVEREREREREREGGKEKKGGAVNPILRPWLCHAFFAVRWPDGHLAPFDGLSVGCISLRYCRSPPLSIFFD